MGYSSEHVLMKYCEVQSHCKLNIYKSTVFNCLHAKICAYATENEPNLQKNVDQKNCQKLATFSREVLLENRFLESANMKKQAYCRSLLIGVRTQAFHLGGSSQARLDDAPHTAGLLGALFHC